MSKNSVLLKKIGRSFRPLYFTGSLSLSLLLTSCSQQATSEVGHIQSDERLAAVELEAEQLKYSLNEVRTQHGATLATLDAYRTTLDALQKGCAQARAIQDTAESAKELAEQSAARAEEIHQLRAQVTDLLRLLESSQKKIQLLESHLQSYWGKIDALQSIKGEVAALKEGFYSKSALSLTTYTVESGDSIEFIARKFNVSASELARINHLSVDGEGALRVGQKLHIPRLETLVK